MNDANRKKLVATAVREAVRNNLHEVARLVGATPDTIELHPVTDLQFHVRIKTQNQGVHYFLVKVSEQI